MIHDYLSTWINAPVLRINENKAKKFILCENEIRHGLEVTDFIIAFTVYIPGKMPFFLSVQCV
jgi:hypothetical protein